MFLLPFCSSKKRETANQILFCAKELLCEFRYTRYILLALVSTTKNSIKIHLHGSS